MKKTIAVALSLGLLGAALVAPAEAAKKKKKPKKVERVAEITYDAPAFGTPSTTGVCFRPTNSCGDIATGATEKFVKMEIDDATGTAVAFTLGQDTDPDALGTETKHGVFCGTTGDKAIKIEPGYALIVFPWVFGDVVCPGAVATTGTITATLSNLP